MPSDELGSRHYERLLHLRRLDSIGTLPPAELALVAEYAQERFFPGGSVLMRAGEPVPAIYFLISGQVRVTRRGRSLGVARQGAGIGGLALLARDPEGIEAVAEGDVLTLEIRADAAQELFEDRFPILHHVLRDVSRRLAQAIRTHGPTLFPEPWQVPLRVPTRSLDLVERLVLLRAAPPFAQASLTTLADLARTLREVRFERDALLWSEGDRAGHTLLVVEGLVRCRSRDGRLDFTFGPGSPVGTLDMVAEVPRFFEARAQTPLLALQGRVEELIDVLEDNHAMATELLAAITRQLLVLLARGYEAPPLDPSP